VLVEELKGSIEHHRRTPDERERRHVNDGNLVVTNFIIVITLSMTYTPISMVSHLQGLYKKGAPSKIKPEENAMLGAQHNQQKKK
jgi:hypothetical protein